MDNCFVDITIEFLAVAFQNILYYASVYPKCVFESRKKYNIVVHHCIHPEVNKYIDLCLKSITECLKTSQLNRIDFAVTDSEYNAIIKFVFRFDRNDYFVDTTDPYLVHTEQNLRAFCLKLSSVSNTFRNIPDDCSFSIHIHTNESTAVSVASNSDFEEFPLIEIEQDQEMETILPLRRFSVRSYIIDAFVELK